jgi:hypothetical protein
MDLLSFQKPMSFLKARKSKKLREKGEGGGAVGATRCARAGRSPVQHGHAEGERQQVGVALEQHALDLVRLAVLGEA